MKRIFFSDRIKYIVLGGLAVLLLSGRCYAQEETPQEYHLIDKNQSIKELPVPMSMYELEDYKCVLNVRVKIKDKYGSDKNYFELYTAYEGEPEQKWGTVQLTGLTKYSWKEFPCTFSTGGKKLKSLKFVSYIAGKKKGTMLLTFDMMTYLMLLGPCAVKDMPNGFVDTETQEETTTILHEYYAEADLYFLPHNIKFMTYPENQFVFDNISGLSISTNFSGGYGNERFKWQYNYHSYGGEWKDFKWMGASASVYASLNMIETDSDGCDFWKNLKDGKNIMVRAVSTCTAPGADVYSKSVAVTPMLAAPELFSNNTATTSPACPGGKNGTVTVDFSRALLESEKLKLRVRSMDLAYTDSVILQNREEKVTFTGLQAGKYEVATIQGSYRSGYRDIQTAISRNYWKVSVTVKDPPPLDLKTALQSTAAHCKSGSDGSIVLTPTGGTGNITAYIGTAGYSVTRDAASSVNGLSAGTYQIELRDANGCSMKKNEWRIQVGEPAKAVAVQQKGNKKDPTGYGKANGEICVVADGGAGGYAYVWQKGGVTLTGVSGDRSTVLRGGTYTIIARDANWAQVTTGSRTGCESSVNITLVEPPELKVYVEEVNPIDCYGHQTGSLHGRAEGGVPGYSYRWQLFYGGQWVDILSEGADTDHREAGNYRVICTDVNGNEATATYVLNQPTAVGVTFESRQPSCKGFTDGWIRAKGTGGVGGYTYEWLFVGVNRDSVRGGADTYTVVVKDKNECAYRENFVLGEPSLLKATCEVTLPTQHDASDGRIEIKAEGGTPYADGSYRYQWDYQGNTTNPLTGIPADSVPYHAVVMDAHRCETEVYPRVIYPLGVEIAVRDSISCSGVPDGRLEALAVGGVSRHYRYEWYKIELDGRLIPAGTEKISSTLFAGHYRVRVTDSEGNVDSAAVVFREPDPLTLELQAHHLLCKHDTDGVLKAVVTGGTTPYHYSWSTGESTQQIEGLAESRYQVEIRDRRGCFIEDTLSIQSPDEVLPLLSFIPPRAYHYSDASVWVTTTGGVLPYTYAWAGRKEVTARIDSVTAGGYEVVVTDRNGCRKVVSIEIPDPPLLEVFISQPRVISCRDRRDARLVASGKGGVGTVYEYQWYKVSDGRGAKLVSGAVADSLPAGVYRVKVTDENRIDAWSADFEVSQPEYLVAQASANSIPCNGGTEGWVEAFVTGGTLPYRYVWTSGDTTARVEGLTDGRYLVLAEDAHGCRAEALTEITVPGGLVITALTEDPVCKGDSNGSISLKVEGGVKPYRMKWENGEEGERHLQLPAGKYQVVITDAHGCFRRNEYVLHDPPQITADIGPDRTLCRDQWCELQRTGEVEAVVYRWFCNGIQIAASPGVRAEEAGVYRLEVEDAAGCMASDETVIHRNEAEIDANFAVAAQVNAGEVVKMVNTSYPEPDSVEWLLPESPEVTVVSCDSVMTEVILNREGSYLFGIRSVVGSCEAVLYKQVNVGTEDEAQPLSRVREPMIQEVFLWPNPNDGHFHVRVRLREMGKGVLRLYTMAGVLVNERKYEGSDYYELEQQEKLPTGVYILQVVCGRERETVKLMVE